MPRPKGEMRIRLVNFRNLIIFSKVVNEAICFGLPVIISNIPNLGFDLVKENENGFKFFVGSAVLTEKLKMLAENKEKRISSKRI